MYEGELINGFPTANGIWTTEKEREDSNQKIDNTASRANNFYKKHRNTWNKFIKYTSVALVVVEVAAPIAGTIMIATGVGAPAGAALITVGRAASVTNVALNVTDAIIATTSASIDTYEDAQNGENVSNALTTLGSQLSVNAAFIVVPKVLKSVPTRKAAVLLSASATSVRNVVKESSVVLSKNKIGRASCRERVSSPV